MYVSKHWILSCMHVMKGLQYKGAILLYVCYDSVTVLMWNIIVTLIVLILLGVH